MTSLKKDVFGLTFANALDSGLQFLVPMIVARVLSPEDFGGYRMCWLVAMTVYVLATLHIPQSLQFFLPRTSINDRIKYITSSFLMLSCFASLSAIFVNPWFPILPLKWIQIGQPLWYLPVFVWFWVMGGLTDYLAVSDGRAQWQVKAIIFLALARTLLIAVAAWVTKDLQIILLAMLLFVMIKVCIVIVYVFQFHRNGWHLDKAIVLKQFRYSLPFGIGQGFYDLRLQSEQWMVAAFFSVSQFASFSLGGVLSPLFYMMRQSINSAVMPKLSALHAEDKIDELAVLNRKATSILAFFLVPLCFILWMYASEVITVIYTSAYIEAVPVMQVYVIGIIPQVFESNLLMRICSLGGFGLKLHVLTLPIAILISYFGIMQFGLAGGALGSVFTCMLTHLFSILKVCTKLNLKINHLYNFKFIFLYILYSIIAVYLSRYVAFYWVDDYFYFLLSEYKTGLALVRAIFGGIYAMLVYTVLCWFFKAIPIGFK